MVCAPVRSIIPSLKLGDYLSVQAHKPCSISHFNQSMIQYKSSVQLPTLLSILHYLLKSKREIDVLCVLL